MKTTLLFIMSAILLFVACGTEEKELDKPDTIQSVYGNRTVVNSPDKIEIHCPDGSYAEILPAADGKDGTDGLNGQDGQDGASGADATPCTVQQGEGLATIKCPDGTTAVIKDGQDGKVKTVRQELIYEGIVCGRTIVRLSWDFYIIRNGLVPLTDKFYKVTNKCSVKIVNRKIVVQETE